MLRWSVAESISSGSTSVDFRPLLWQTTGDDRGGTKAESKHFNYGIWIHCVNYASLVSGTRNWCKGEIWCEREDTAPICTIHSYAVICGQQEPCSPGNYSCRDFVRADRVLISPKRSYVRNYFIPRAHSLTMKACDTDAPFLNYSCLHKVGLPECVFFGVFIYFAKSLDGTYGTPISNKCSSSQCLNKQGTLVMPVT